MTTILGAVIDLLILFSTYARGRVRICQVGFSNMSNTNMTTILQESIDQLVLTAFSRSNRKKARDALVLHKHQWLRLRPLSKSPAHVQEKAKEIQMQLRPTRVRPKTNAVVARRMVESTLGLRSTVSKEQREAERKQLSDARGPASNFDNFAAKLFTIHHIPEEFCGKGATFSSR
ncbi:hypothetical protein Y032_0016g2888 [Ancylostoma ceylanicum]|uniref:Uncharacterized protein n=1 Tax=Ancylostoma ceylanicum TaxID=53326 RepID=A0A016V5F2_9BILA|nr:hypothetical protein Y032_0016g2888 [Ancylostoma ceylanicum]